MADPTPVIAFEGLLHFQTGAKQKKHQVVMIDATHHGHTPQITIYRKADLGDKVDVPTKKGDIVTFDVTGAPTRYDDLYDQYVPELRRHIAYGQIDPLVVYQKPHDGVWAYIDLPPGDLSTWGSFEHPVLLTDTSGGKKQQPFARFAVLETGPNYPKKLIVRGQPVDVNHDDLIVVSNKSLDKSHLHFPLYADILTKYGQLNPIKILEDVANDKDVGKKYQFRDAIEDALAKLDQAAPNADCGPTGP